MLGYTFLGETAGPTAILPLEALHGLAFAGSWAAGTDYCARLAPPGLKSTAQSLFSAAYAGVGGGLGALLGGSLYSAAGAHACFAGTAGLVVAAWLPLTMWEAQGQGGEKGLAGVADVDGAGLLSAPVAAPPPAPSPSPTSAPAALAVLEAAFGPEPRAGAGGEASEEEGEEG